MNRQEFEANWNQVKPKILEKWNKFTQEEISRFDGKYDTFLSNLQKKYGYSREQADQEISNWNVMAAKGKVEPMTGSCAPCDARDKKAGAPHPGQNRDRREEKKRKAG